MSGETDAETAAVLVAAGKGVRAGGGAPKQYRPLGGETSLVRAARMLARHPRIGETVVVVAAEEEGRARSLLEAAGLDLAVAHGGASRADSVRNGLDALKSAPAFVFVHDAARPLAPAALIDEGLKALRDGADASVPALPVADTLKRADAEGVITETPPREGLWRAQTPQGFRTAALKAAFARFGAEAARFTDEAALVAAAGGRAVVHDGHDHAMKITRPEDFAAAERLLETKMTYETRTGMGFDVHAFGRGDHVILCGVKIPHARGLKGHSDADVALHTVTDALLGAIGEGDIGQHFPPSDDAWKGADSKLFLREAVAMMAAKGGRIVNVDLTIIGEEPKINPHRGALRAALAEVLGVTPSRVNVKATTTERLGFPGRGEGLAALASCSVALPENA